MIYRFNAAGTDQLNGMANTGVVLALRALANSGATFSTATTCENVPGTGPFDKFEGCPPCTSWGPGCRAHWRPY
jgi:hypothetical protein